MIFEVNIVEEQKQAQLATIFLLFLSFHCPQLFYCPPPCSTASPASIFVFLATLQNSNNVAVRWPYSERIESFIVAQAVFLAKTLDYTAMEDASSFP